MSSPGTASSRLRKLNLPVVCSGEDLTKYRVQSRKVWRLVKRIVGPKCPVEKLGMDELFVDVTALMQAHLQTTPTPANRPGTVWFACGKDGFSYSEETSVRYTAPGDKQAVRRPHVIAAYLAAFIREAIHQELGLTVSGGVADTKLMAKLLAAVNKPAKQTCLSLQSDNQLQFFLDPIALQK